MIVMVDGAGGRGHQCLSLGKYSKGKEWLYDMLADDEMVNADGVVDTLAERGRVDEILMLV
jgi:hypothetical protein